MRRFYWQRFSHLFSQSGKACGFYTNFPAAIQRVPDNEQAKSEDIYQIGVEEKSDTIERLAIDFREWFLLGIKLLTTFIVWRVACPIITKYISMVLPEYLSPYKPIWDGLLCRAAQ